MSTALCAVCASPFAPQRSTVKFCINRCRKRAERFRLTHLQNYRNQLQNLRLLGAQIVVPIVPQGASGRSKRRTIRSSRSALKQTPSPPECTSGIARNRLGCNFADQ